jgi:hypothetical protein
MDDELDVPEEVMVEFEQALESESENWVDSHVEAYRDTEDISK